MHYLNLASSNYKYVGDCKIGEVSFHESNILGKEMNVWRKLAIIYIISLNRYKLIDESRHG